MMILSKYILLLQCNLDLEPLNLVKTCNLVAISEENIFQSYNVAKSCNVTVFAVAKSVPKSRVHCTKYIHDDPLMMSQKEAPRKHPCVLPRKVVYLV